MADYDRSFVPLPIFCGENYDFWSIKMRTYFRSQNLWKVVREGFNIPENASTLTATQKKELEDDQQKDSQALFALQQALVDDIFSRIMGASTAKEAWDTLQEEFQRNKKVSIRSVVSTADKQVNSGLSLKSVVDVEKNRVIFVEADSDFVDILFSFLTIPIGTTITLAQNRSVPTGLGCITNLHKSVEKMDVRYFHFHSGAGKLMLLRPRTEAESHCDNLKLKIDDSEPQKFFFCSSSICTHKSYNLSSPYRDVLCKCRRPMNREVKLTKSLSKEQHVVKGAFVNVNTTFLVTDELQVVPMSTAATLSLFAKHGLADDSSIKEIVFNVGADEILKLLLCTIVTKTPFTEILLKQTETPPLNCLSTLHRKSNSQKEEIFKLSNDIQERNIAVKLMVSKSKKMVCYAEAHKDFVNLLFSFLTVPLSYMGRNLSGVVPFRGCLHHFYKSVQDLGEQFFISNCHKEILVNPRLPFGFRYRNNLLGIGKASHPPYYSAFCTNITRKHEPFMTTDKSLIPSYYNDSVLLKVIDTATDYAADCNGNDGGIVSGPTTMFMVTDSLIITPLSSSSCVSILKELKVPFNDVEEMVVYVGKIEAMRLLLASFVSGSALTNIFIRNSD